MALKFQSVRGTRDLVPAETAKWRHVERVAMETCACYGVGELRFPTIEHTELFTRSVGETTDVVQKEMYTMDKEDESITLRPEGTAGAARAVLEQNLLEEVLPVKICYFINCFRHEKPQAGRFREFRQFGVECYGNASPTADAEVIGLAYEVLNRLGIDDLSLEINSIGCPACRPGYNRALVDYYRSHESELCDTCLGRLEKNPLRLLDCKEEHCKALSARAPRITEHLCAECAEHFSGLQAHLDAMGVRYKVNPFIVRGLDYYTKTVFEVISANIGAQSTVCGGGRYDGLIEELGGQHTPALGFAMGLDRLLMVMEKAGIAFPEERGCDLYIGSMGEQENIRALALAGKLRAEGFAVLCDTVGRSVKAQMRYANRMGARHACIIGSQELEQNAVNVKIMDSGEQQQVAMNAEAMASFLYDAMHRDIVEQGPGPA